MDPNFLAGDNFCSLCNKKLDMEHLSMIQFENQLMKICPSCLEKMKPQIKAYNKAIDEKENQS